jgi:hypothetical protein
MELNALYNLITLLGGTIKTSLSSGNGIYINSVGISSSSINTISGLTNGYNSSYDAILHYNSAGTAI